MLSTQVASLINIGSNYLNSGTDAKRWGTAHQSIVPYEAFPTKDGYFTIGTGSNAQFAELCKKIGHPNVAKDPKYLTNTTRVQNRDELLTFLRNILKTKTNDEWRDIFEESSFPCGPINSIKETFNDPHIKAIGLVQSLKRPTGDEIKIVGPPVKYSDGGNSVRLPPPTLGEHTDEVLQEVLGLSVGDINSLRERNIVQ